MATLRGCKITLLHEDGTHGIVFAPPHCKKIKIGSSIICDIRIKNDQTRKVHCIIFPDANVIKIKNLSKSHPVLLNGVPIKREHILNNRDTITVVQRQFLWSIQNKLKRLSAGKTCEEENAETRVNHDPKDGAAQSQKLDGPVIKLDNKTIGRRITCKINKIPIGKRWKAAKRITIHDFRDENKIVDSSEEDNEYREDEVGPHITIQASSTPFRTIQNKNLSISKLCNLGKSDSLVWSVSPATLSHRGKSTAKSFTTFSHHNAIANELVDVDTPENTIIKKTLSSSVYLVDLTTPDTSNFNKSRPFTPNKSGGLYSKSFQTNSSVFPKTPKSNLHTVANSTIKKLERPASMVKKVLNMTSSMMGTPAAEKRKALFLNKSVTSHPTILSESLKITNLSLSTINKRKTINLNEAQENKTKTNFLKVGATPGSSIRKSMGGYTTPAKIHVKDRVATPGRAKLQQSVNEVAGIQNDLIETKQLSLNIPPDDLATAPSVAELMEKPDENKASELMILEKHNATNDLTALDDLQDTQGLEAVVNTSRNQIPTNDLTDVRGVKELMKTPGKNAPTNDLTDVRGVKELMKTPGKHIPTNDLSDVRGLKELLNTPARDDLCDVNGVKILFNTPHEGHNPDFTVNFDTITNMINSSYDFDSESNNVSVCTLPPIDIAPDTTNIEEIEDGSDQDDDTEFNEDFISKNTSLDENKTMEEIFDELVGKKTVTKTYSRNKSITPDKKNNLTELQTENIEKWVESVANDAIQPKPNNNQQILSNRYSNVTPQTSVIEPLENNRADTDDESDERSSHDSEAMELFEKNAISDPIDPQVSFRFENYDLSSGSDSESIKDESALLNDVEDGIIPSTQQQQNLCRDRLESNDSKGTYIIEDDVIVPETQVEVFQGDMVDDGNEFGFEMSSQALETNISLVLNGEEAILSDLVDNNDDDSRDTYIVETQMPQEIVESEDVDKQNESSILFIDDTIFIEKSKTSAISDFDQETDDSSVILCYDDSKNAGTIELRQTRSKSETPKKVNRNKLLNTRKTMGDTLSERSAKKSKFHQEIEQCSSISMDNVARLKMLRKKSKTVSPPKRPSRSPIIKNKSLDVIDLSESLDESTNESIESEVASMDEFGVKHQSEISGIEPLQNDGTMELVYENSDDEIIGGVFDHLEKDDSIYESRVDTVNKTASQMMVEECLEMDSDVFQNFDENEIILHARGTSLSPKSERKAKSPIKMYVFNKTISDINYEASTDIGFTPPNKIESDQSSSIILLSDLTEGTQLRSARSKSETPKKLIRQASKATRKTMGGPINESNTSVKKIVDDESQIFETSNSSSIEIELDQSSSIILLNDLALEGTELRTTRSKSETPKKLNRETIKATRKTMGGPINESNTSVKKIVDDESQISETTNSPTSIEIELDQSSSIILLNDLALEGTELRSTRSKSETPKKMNRETIKATRKTMGDPINESNTSVKEIVDDEFQISETTNSPTSIEIELDQSSSISLLNDLVLEGTELRSTRSKSETPKKLNRETIKEIRKTMGGPINESNTSIKKIVDDESQISETTNSPSIEIELDQSSSIILLNDLAIEGTELRSARSKSETPKRVSRVSSKATRKTIGGPINESNSDRDALLISETTANPEKILDTQSSSLINDFEVEATNVRSTRSESKTPQKLNRVITKATRKTMVNPINESHDSSLINQGASDADWHHQYSTDSHTKHKDINQQKSASNSLNITDKSLDVIDLSESDAVSTGNEESTCILVYSDSEDEMMDGIFDNMKKDDESENKTALHTNLEVKIIESISDKMEKESTIVANYPESESNSVSQFMGEEVAEMNSDEVLRKTPTKELVPKNSNLSRETVGDQLDHTEKMKSKFESEINDISLYVNEIDQAPVTERRRAMSIGNKSKSPRESVSQNKTICEINYKELPDQKIDVCSDNPQPQSPEIEKIVNETVIEFPVSSDINLDDTFEHDGSDNLFNDDESGIIIPETQEIPVDSESYLNSESIVIIPETQPDPEHTSMSDIQISKSEISITDKSRLLHRLSLNSTARTPSPKQMKSQSSKTKPLPNILVENVDESEQADTVDEIFVKTTPATRQRRLYSKETYTPDFGDNNVSAADLHNNPTSTPFSKNGTNFDELNFSTSMITHNMVQAKCKILEQIQPLVPENTVADRNVRSSGKMIEGDEEQFAKPELVETIDSSEKENEVVGTAVILKIMSSPENLNIEISPRKRSLEIEKLNAESCNIVRRVVFAEKPEEKYFEVLSEYEESIKKPVRNRRPLIRHEVVAKKKINLDNTKKEETEEPLHKKIRGEEINQQDDEVAPSIPKGEMVEKKTGRGRKKRAVPPKKNIGSLEIEPASIVEEKIESSSSHEPTNIVPSEDMEQIMVVESCTISAHLELSNDVQVERKMTSRSKGRRAPVKKELEMISESKANTKQTISRELKAVLIEVVGAKQTTDEDTMISGENSDELIDSKVIGPEKVVEMGITEEKEEIISDTNADVNNEITTTVPTIPPEETEAVKQVVGRGRRAVAKKSEIEAEHFDIKLVSPKKGGRVHRQAINQKNLDPEPEDESTPDVKPASDTVTSREVSTNEKTIEAASNTDNKDGDKQDVTVSVGNANMPSSSLSPEIFATPLKPAIRGRRPAITTTVDVTVSDSELAPQSPPIRKRHRAIKIPSRYLDETDRDTDTSKTTPVKSRGRPRTQKQPVYETDNEELNQTPKDKLQIVNQDETPSKLLASDASNNEQTDEVLQKPSRGGKVAVIKSSKPETPVKSRGRRGAAKKTTIDLGINSPSKENSQLVNQDKATSTLLGNKMEIPVKILGRRGAHIQTANRENEQLGDTHQSDADTVSNEHTDEIPEKPLRGRKDVAAKLTKTETPVKSRSRRGAQKQSGNESESDEVTNTVNNEHTDENVETASRVRKVAAIKLTKIETPVKSRGRRGAPKQTVDEMEKAQVTDIHDNVGASNEQTDEIVEKSSRGLKVTAAKLTKMETPVKSRGRRGARKQTVDEMENDQVSDTHDNESTSNEQTDEIVEISSRGRKVAPAKLTKMETPVKSRGRRGAPKQTVDEMEDDKASDTHDSESTSNEQIDEIVEKSSRGRKIAAAKLTKMETPVKSRGRRGAPKQTVDEMEDDKASDTHDSESISNEQTDDIVEKSSRGLKVTAAKLTKMETPVKSRGRRGARKQTVDEIENDQVGDPHDSNANTAASNEHPDKVDEKPSRGRKVAATKLGKMETPVKPRSRRGAQNQTVDETRDDQVIDNHERDADTVINKQTDEIETPVKSRGRRGAQKQTVVETENTKVNDSPVKENSEILNKDEVEPKLATKKAKKDVPAQEEITPSTRGRRRAELNITIDLNTSSESVKDETPVKPRARIGVALSADKIPAKRGRPAKNVDKLELEVSATDLLAVGSTEFQQCPTPVSAKSRSRKNVVVAEANMEKLANSSRLKRNAKDMLNNDGDLSTSNTIETLKVSRVTRSRLK